MKRIKAEHYAHIKQIGEKFKNKVGALTCGDPLHLDEYDNRLQGCEKMEKPCPKLVAFAAKMLSDYIEEQELKKAY